VDRSTEGQDWADLMHFASIVRLDPTVLPPPFPLPPPPQAPTENQSALDVIAGDFMLLGMPLNANTCVKFLWRIQKKEQSNGWKQLPEVVQNMILELSAVSDKILPVCPCKTYLCLLNQPKALGVAMVLNIKLSIRVCHIEVPTTMENAIKMGSSKFPASHTFVFYFHHPIY